MDPLPSRIGRYIVESLVGVGGMGQIYKAHDPDIGRPVAGASTRGVVGGIDLGPWSVA